MRQFNKIWFFWLVLIIVWNYGWPEVTPLYDVIVAVFISIIVFNISNYKKSKN